MSSHPWENEQGLWKWTFEMTLYIFSFAILRVILGRVWRTEILRAFLMAWGGSSLIKNPRRSLACAFTGSPPPCCVPSYFSQTSVNSHKRYSLFSSVYGELRGRAGWWFRGEPWPSLRPPQGTAMPIGQYSEGHRQQQWWENTGLGC